MEFLRLFLVSLNVRCFLRRARWRAISDKLKADSWRFNTVDFILLYFHGCNFCSLYFNIAITFSIVVNRLVLPKELLHVLISYIVQDMFMFFYSEVVFIGFLSYFGYCV